MNPPLIAAAVAIAVLLALLIGVWWQMRRKNDAQVRQIHEMQTALGIVRREYEMSQKERSEARDHARTLAEQLEGFRERYGHLERNHAVLQTRFEEASRQHEEKIRLLEEAKSILSAQFENLANRIFEQRSKAFDAAKEQQLQLLLKPFREQIANFSEQARRQFVDETKERHLLKDEIGRLKQLNERISEDALNLTNALKGANKTQGNWGEIVLERVLESSGLRKGHEYETQGSYQDAAGRQLRPDVIVFLPDERCVVVDSKVSLVAYEQFMNTDDPAHKAQALKQHLASVNAHVRGLSEKKYETLGEIRSLDFVLMFMPIEGAFQLAMEHDNGFYKKAYDAGIIVVGPTTLLATLRTIEHLWRTEQQQQNALQIARQAEDLYDKFVLFVEDMQRIGEQLGKTQETWEKAMNKLQSGKGNLIRRAEQMKKLGLRPKKQLPDGEEAS